MDYFTELELILLDLLSKFSVTVYCVSGLAKCDAIIMSDSITT